jgi:hypothetical protein
MSYFSEKLTECQTQKQEEFTAKLPHKNADWGQFVDSLTSDNIGKVELASLRKND